MKHLNPRLRRFLWSVFLGLTTFILIYPVKLRLEPFVLLSTDVFPNLPFFGTLFYLWAVSLFVLLFTSTNERTAKWEGLFLVAIAGLVFRGFWNIIAPMQLEAVNHATTAKVWQNLGHVVWQPGISYIDWPTTSLLGSVLSQITGLEFYPAIAALTVFITIVIAIATYVFLLGVLKTSLQVSLASLLIIAGNLALIIYYQPGPIAIVFVVLFLAELFSKTALLDPSRIPVILLLLIGATFTHLPSAMIFFFILIAIWGFNLLIGQWPEPKIVIVLLLLLILPFAWVFYWQASGFMRIWVGIWTTFFNPLVRPERWTSVFTIWQANFGKIAPLWYKLTRLFWLVLLCAAGGLLWLWNLVRFRRLSLIESKLCAAFCGLVFLNIVTCLVSPRGSAELLRGLTYVSFFTVPLLFLFLQRFKSSAKKITLVSLAFLLVGLSFPSFLTNNSRINSDSSHPIEFSTGQWLQSLYGTGKGLNIFSTASTYGPIQFYLFDAAYTAERQTHEFESWSEESLWQAMDDLLAGFDSFSKNGNSGFFIHSPKEALQRAMTFNVPYNHPRWKEITSYLSKKNCQIYDNGPIQIYAH